MALFSNESDITALILYLSLTLTVAAISGIFSAKNVLWFMSLLQSKICPPRKTFRFMWTMSYTTMGIASFIIWNEVKTIYCTPMILYFLQLSFNSLYCPLFFGLKRLDIALIDILILDLILAICTFNFFQISMIAGVLMVPYFGWTLYSTALNADFYRLQIGQQKDPVFFTSNYSPHHLYQSTLETKNAKENNNFFSTIPETPKKLSTDPPLTNTQIFKSNEKPHTRFRFGAPEGIYVQ